MVTKMGIFNRKSQKLSIEIQNWMKLLQELNTHQNILAKKLFEQIKLLLNENQDEKVKIAEKIEDLIFDSLDKQNDVLSIVESIGGIEHEIVKVNHILTEIKEENNILEEIRLSIKNLIKSTLDIKKDMQKNIIKEIEENIGKYKLKRDQISKSLTDINTKLSSNLKKIDFI